MFQNLPPLGAPGQSGRLTTWHDPQELGLGGRTHKTTIPGLPLSGACETSSSWAPAPSPGHSGEPWSGKGAARRGTWPWSPGDRRRGHLATHVVQEAASMWPMWPMWPSTPVDWPARPPLGEELAHPTPSSVRAALRAISSLSEVASLTLSPALEQGHGDLMSPVGPRARRPRSDPHKPASLGAWLLRTGGQPPSTLCPSRGAWCDSSAPQGQDPHPAGAFSAACPFTEAADP